ncbi:MAG: hypothetical protein WD873_05040, partial [Candidatus Hydrogenedentales bacterium]
MPCVHLHIDRAAGATFAAPAFATVRAMAERHIDIVRAALQQRADRGAFRGLDEPKGRGGRTEFQFKWLLDRIFTVVVDDKHGVLTLQNALPNVGPRSQMDRELRQWAAARADAKLPPHRRVQPGRAELSLVNRGGNVSLRLKVKRNQYAYAIKKLLDLTNELFGYLQLDQQQYLWDELNVPQVYGLWHGRL